MHMRSKHVLRLTCRTFYDPAVPTPVKRTPCFLLHFLPPLLVGGPRGSGHPDPDFRWSLAQHNQQPCSRSTNRRNTPCHGFHDNSR